MTGLSKKPDCNIVLVSCGGVVYRQTREGVEILVRKTHSQVFGHDNFWHLPKGVRKAQETNQEAVKREIQEETGGKLKS